jgi:hypothetical protein
MSDEPQVEGQSEGPSEEERASQDGWVPQEQWRGPAEKWRGAAEFNARGAQFHAILSKKTKTLEESLASQAAKNEELTRTLREFGEHHARTLESERKKHEAQIKRFEAEKLKADDAGDLDAYKAAERGIQELKAVEPPKPAPTQPPQHPDVTAFLVRNKWFDSDAELAAAATAFSDRLARAEPNLTIKENLAKVEDGIRRIYPEKFGNPNRMREQSVESGSIPMADRGSKRDYSALPPEAKAACDRFVKQKVLTRDQYVAQFDWDGR